MVPLGPTQLGPSGQSWPSPVLVKPTAEKNNMAILLGNILKSDPHQLTLSLTYIYSNTLYLAFYLTYIVTLYLEFFEAYIRTFHLAFYLAFYLTYVLTFFVAFYLAYILTFGLAFYLAFCLAFYLTFFLACVRVQVCPAASRAGEETPL